MKDAVELPDGSGVFTTSTPLPRDHWLYTEDPNPPPMLLRCGTKDPKRRELEAAIRAGVQYALKAATHNGSVDDYDPDAVVINAVIGILGYFTPDGTQNTSDVHPTGQSGQLWSRAERDHIYEVLSKRYEPIYQWNCGVLLLSNIKEHLHPLYKGRKIEPNTIHQMVNEIEEVVDAWKARYTASLAPSEKDFFDQIKVGLTPREGGHLDLEPNEYLRQILNGDAPLRLFNPPMDVLQNMWDDQQDED